MSEKPLHVQPDRMRDVVEKLLVIFLSDPLVEPPPADVPADPFDLPSTSRPRMMRSVTDSHVFTGSPVSKKRPTANRPAPT